MSFVPNVSKLCTINPNEHVQSLKVNAISPKWSDLGITFTCFVVEQEKKIIKLCIALIAVSHVIEF